jgi:hypothetical protein
MDQEPWSASFPHSILQRSETKETRLQQAAATIFVAKANYGSLDWLDH